MTANQQPIRRLALPPSWSLAALLLCLGLACRTPGQQEHEPVSTTSSLHVGPFQPASGATAWTSMAIDLRPTDGKNAPLHTAFTASDYQSDGATAGSVQVPYGSYTIAFTYQDAGGRTVYQDCPDVVNQSYAINQPAFTAAVAICAVGSAVPAGNPVAVSGSQPAAGPSSPASGSQTPPVTAAAGAGRNPFQGSVMFVNPAYTANVQATAAANPLQASQMAAVASLSTAFWISRVADISTAQALLATAAATTGQQQGSGAPTVATFVVYDLPDRDCAANASNGEFHSAANGLALYEGYIDQIVTVLQAYPALLIAIILEPDSLANLATNMGNPKCAAAQPTYQTATAYAIAHLGALANVSLYLDSGHSGWLGWPNDRAAMAAVVKGVLQAAGGQQLIRGFATNVSNYSPLSVPAGTTPAWYDPSNPAKDELTFVSLITQDYQNAGITNTNFIIDTGRNGNLNSRASWHSWCNVANAGLGVRPTAAPQAGIDAYLWVKPPGESDGTSDGAAANYDWMCSTADALQSATVVAPQAGQWFAAHFLAMLSKGTP